VRKKLAALVVAAFAVAVMAGRGDVVASPPTTTRASVASDGTQANATSLYPVISADGRFVAFTSDASNLAPNDTVLCPGPPTRSCSDIFVHDTLTGVTESASVNDSGSGGNYHSYYPTISSDGSVVAFVSEASNLVSGAAGLQVYVRDIPSGTTTVASVDSTGIIGNGHTQPPIAVSGDGRFIAFASRASNLVQEDTFTGPDDVFLHDMQTGMTSRVSETSDGVPANSYSCCAAISADGRYVAYASTANNLGPHDSFPGQDVYVYDRVLGNTELVSIGQAGSGANDNSCPIDPGCIAISADGRHVAFVSSASNLVPSDTNGKFDVFVRDRQLNTTERVSVGSADEQGIDYSCPILLSSFPCVGISANGRFVTFHSLANNLVSGDTNYSWDVFIRDRQAKITMRASVSGGGDQSIFGGNFGSPNGGASKIAFVSCSEHLVADDTNRVCDVFVRDLQDSNGDGVADPFDFATDWDADLAANPVETKCDSNPLSAISGPERIDTAGDDDGDGLVNEALPAGAAAFDCDGDGYVGSVEAGATTSDQDPCGASGWPSDIVSTDASANRLDLQDLGSFVAPVRRLGTSPGHPNFSARWDLVQGSVVGPAINVQDIAALLTGASGYPPMFGGQRAFGQVCPYEP
jgi:Tol biopolymer transport system component